MNEFLKKIKNLSPEKQAELLAKLKKSKNNVVKDKIDFTKNFQYSNNSDKPFDFSLLQTEVSDPGPNHVQIRAKASSLNFRDVMIAFKKYPIFPGIPTNMGSDYAGIIEKVGKNVTDFKIGDEVIASHCGHSEELTGFRDNCHFIKTFNTDTANVYLKPKKISFEEASCIPTVFLTSYLGLIKLGKLKESDNLLIHTATGGVGLSSIEIANWKKASIYATAGTEEKRAYLKKNGIKNIYDSRSLEFAETLKSKNIGMDIVMNTLDGDRMIESIKLLNPFGRFIHIDKKDIAKDTPLGMKLFTNGILFQFLDITLLFFDTDLLRSSLQEIVELFESELIKPIYYQTYHVSELKKVMTVMSRGTHIGKFVLKYD
jgi:NADPH:quinone reductase-like Zn-dependent oxidoreductase|tara:strand:- start:4824 stop:5939 length:1116 start_codon:yes stop_codon:yes gene_type:complete